MPATGSDALNLTDTVIDLTVRIEEKPETLDVSVEIGHRDYEDVIKTPAVFPRNVIGLQPCVEAMPDSGSATFQLIATSLRYQLLFPSTPETRGVITGGVVSILSCNKRGGASTLRARSVLPNSRM